MSRRSSKGEALSTLELLEEVEAEMKRLRAKNKRLTAEIEKLKMKPRLVVIQRKETGEEPAAPPVTKRALGKGLSQLFGGPKRG